MVRNNKGLKMKLFELHRRFSYATEIIQLLRNIEPDMIDDLATIFNTYGINIYEPVEEIENQLRDMDTGETRHSPLNPLYNKVVSYINGVSNETI